MCAARSKLMPKDILFSEDYIAICELVELMLVFILVSFAFVSFNIKLR